MHSHLVVTTTEPSTETIPQKLDLQHRKTSTAPAAIDLQRIHQQKRHKKKAKKRFTPPNGSQRFLGECMAVFLHFLHSFLPIWTGFGVLDRFWTGCGQVVDRFYFSTTLGTTTTWTGWTGWTGFITCTHIYIAFMEKAVQPVQPAQSLAGVRL